MGVIIERTNYNRDGVEDSVEEEIANLLVVGTMCRVGPGAGAQ